MNAPFIHFRFLLLLTVVGIITISCKKKKDADPTPALRTPIDYNLLTPSTPYTKYFVDAKGDTTVDRTEGRKLLRMLTAMDVYCKSSVASATAIDSTILSNMFHNKSNAFIAPYLDLNGLNYSVQKYTATSTTFKAKTDQDFEKMFGAIARASLSVSNTADKGSAGVYTDGSAKYLVDTSGLEYAEILVNSFIGAVQLDYISNVLLFKGITESNLVLVPGKNYTPLEHNWDMAYGLFTANDIYALGATDDIINGGETFIGEALWKYNKKAYKNIYLSFLKGRAAIVNNDINELRIQAVIIRKNLESAIGTSAAFNISESAQAPAYSLIAKKTHCFSISYGSIYALRFCTLIGGNPSFSDGLKNKLLNSTVTRIENIDTDQYWVVYNDINNKFGFYK